MVNAHKYGGRVGGGVGGGGWAGGDGVGGGDGQAAPCGPDTAAFPSPAPCRPFHHPPGRLGLLFHAAEYPARCPAFDVHLGRCQDGSGLAWSEAGADWRNLVMVGVREGGARVGWEMVQVGVGGVGRVTPRATCHTRASCSPANHPTPPPTRSKGRLASVNAAPGTPLAAALVWPGLVPLRTLQEGDLGAPLADVLYLPVPGIRGGGRVWVAWGGGGGE